MNLVEINGHERVHADDITALETAFQKEAALLTLMTMKSTLCFHSLQSIYEPAWSWTVSPQQRWPPQDTGFCRACIPRRGSQNNVNKAKHTHTHTEDDLWRQSQRQQWINMWWRCGIKEK